MNEYGTSDPDNSKPPGLSRRELFTPGYYKELAERANDAVSPEVKEAAFEGVSNVAIIAALATLAIKGGREKLSVYSVDSERKLKDLSGFQEKMAKSLEMRTVVADLAKSFATLYSAWENAYYVSETTTDEDGKTTTTWSWDEPFSYTSRGLNHKFIEKMRNYYVGIDGELANLQNSASQYFDFSRGGSAVFYEEHLVDKDKQVRIASAAYGVVGLAFMLYEEGIHAVSKAQDNRAEPIVDSGKYVSRRAFMKIVGALLGYVGLRKVQNKFAQKNTFILEDIREHTAQQLAALDVPDVDNFKRFFGTSPEVLANSIERARAVLQSCQEIPGWQVKNQIAGANAAATASQTAFKDYFGEGDPQIPRELTEITGYAGASESILEYVDGKTSAVKLRHVANAAALALGFGTLAAFCEAFAFPAADALRSKS